MSFSLFNAIPAGAIKVLTDGENQPWFKRAHVGKFLELQKILMSVKGLDECEIKTRDTVNPKVNNAYRWSGPKDQQNKTDVFLSVYGVVYAIMKSRKRKGIELREWIMRDVVPRGFKKLIEEKDTQLALLNDDLTIAQQNVVVLEQDNLEIQAEVARLKPRDVPHLEDPRKDNGIVVIQKNNGDPYPYLAICGQQGYVAQKIQNKLVDYPNGQIVVLGETLNAIICYNWLRERGCIVANPDRVRDFRLGENYSHQRLIELQDA